MTKPDPNAVHNILTKAEATAIRIAGSTPFNKTSKNSLEAQANRDPELAAKIAAGRREEGARYRSMEAWALAETSGGSPVLV